MGLMHPGHIFRTGFVLGLVSLALTACTSIGSGSALIDNATGDSKNAGIAKADGPTSKKVYTAADFAPDVYCPPVVLRPGTEAFPVYEKGHDGDQDFVRFQAAISKTARECHMDGDTLTIKVGVNGRLVAGPKGSAGSLTLPLRIAIVKQTAGDKGPLYSKLFKMPVSVTGPTFSSDFSQVFDGVSVKISPDDHDLIVYVGFDEGKKPEAPAG